MMNSESNMKTRGENKVWKAILNKSRDGFKKVHSTQVGKQLLLDEGIRILGGVQYWIDNGSANVYRKAFQQYFDKEEFLLRKIVETMLLLSGDISNGQDKTNKSTRHRKISTLKKRVFMELDFDSIWRITEVIVDLSQYFDLEYVKIFSQKETKTKVQYTCNLSEVIVDKLRLEAAEAFYPLPMTSKPIDWEAFEYVDEDTGELCQYVTGGYETYSYEMIRFTDKIDYSKYSPKIFKSVNYIQSTPWIVNKDVLVKVKEDLSPPKKEDFVFTDYPSSEGCCWDVDIKEDKELSKVKINQIKIARGEYSDQAQLYNAECGDYESAFGKYQAVKLAVDIAEKYKDEKVIYFPHNYDFRGRVYPLPVGLSPQGSDAVKALLLYKNKEELTQEGAKWNWAYLSSLYGEDKLPFDERVERGKQLLHEDYKQADEPYQFLSHQLELQRWMSEKDYIPNTRIHLDACNSGSQFTSAITGDKIGCEATNVIPTYVGDGQDRQDAYLLVAEKAIQLTTTLIKDCEDFEKQEIYKFLLSLLKKSGRKICKTPTMVSNYGGTAQGRAEILFSMFRELGCDREWVTKKNASTFSKIIGDSIQGVLVGGKAFERYIQKMCNLIARNDRKICWTTSDGFYVIHKKNKELKSKKVSITLPNARKQIQIIKKVYSKRLSPAKMRSAISPNYIHSLDAELLRRVALKMKKKGVLDSDWIHDSFGCHPNHVDLMLKITKKEFLKLVKRKPLDVLNEELKRIVPNDKESQKALLKIDIPNLGGFNLKEDIEKVTDSDWFFS